jgi:tetratricopeptide (TPR) repeat protein
MGVLAVAPVLISQLMSFSRSLPFVLAIAFLANLPGFAVFVLASCFAAACRPLRFRSRFIAIVLCTAPQLFYWAYFGGARQVEPVKWGLSFAPWIDAWIAGLALAALVLGIGHFTRYRPGLVWVTSAGALAVAFCLFQTKVGFTELDYQLYVVRNDPEKVVEFHDQSITELLDDLVKEPSERFQRYLESSFYPTDSIQLRQALKEEIALRLSQGRWPGWFEAPSRLRFRTRRRQLLDRYDLFIGRRARSRRMPVALYYKAILSELHCDMRVFKEKELLHFYSDYPFEDNMHLWIWLLTEFGQSPESMEARWRIAVHLAGMNKFDEADSILEELLQMADRRLELLQKRPKAEEALFRLFRPPADSVMTAFKTLELQRRANQLRTLIGPQNRAGGNMEQLAEFVLLNPHHERFSWELDGLLSQTTGDDPLRDNILLAKIKLIADEQLRAEKLRGLHRDMPGTDGGMHALYELGLLKISQWRRHDRTQELQKQELLAEARQLLTEFLDLYPDSPCSDQVRKNIEDLPAAG